MNVSYVVIIYFTSLFVLSVADVEKPIEKRSLKLKNVNFNKTEGKLKNVNLKKIDGKSKNVNVNKTEGKPGKPKSTKKSQKNKTIFVLTNPVVYPEKLISPKPPEKLIINPTRNFDFLNFDAYILKPRNINYTALLSNTKNDVKDKEVKSFEQTTHYPQHEIVDFPRAEPLIQTTTTSSLETIPYETTPRATTPRAKTPRSTIPHDTIPQETTTPKINSYFPLGLAYFDSLRKYRKAFDSLRKKERTKKPRIKTTTTTSTTARTTTETDPPFIEATTDYVYVATPNFDEDLYEEPHFESYRYKPRFHHYAEDESERTHYETTTRYLDYDTLDRDDNHYEPTEVISTTARPPNSHRRKVQNTNLHSANVKSNYLYDRHINYPQAEESRRVVSVAKLDNYKNKRNGRNNTQTVEETGTEGGDKKHKNIVPMQRHYFQ